MTTSQPGLVARLGREIGSEIDAIAFSGPTARVAFRAALAGVLAVVVAMALRLDDPYWAGITAFGMLQHDAAATLSRSFDRVLGTLTGAALGYLFSATVSDHLVFSAIAGCIVGFTLYAQARVDHSYAVLLVGVTALLVMFGSLITPGAALTIAVYRGLEIVVGAVMASVVDIMLAPNPAHPQQRPPKPGVFSKPVDVDLLVVAVTAGLAIASVPSIWIGLELPSLDQTPITAFVIMIAIQRDPYWTAATRATGCIAGGAYGLLCLGFIDASFFLWISLLFLGLYASGHILHRGGEASYVGHQAGVAVILAMVEGPAPSPDILPAIDRLVGIFGGIVVVALFQVLFSPLVRRYVLAATPNAPSNLTGSG